MTKMKVKQKMSPRPRRSRNDLLGTPLQKINPKRNALDDTASPAPTRFSPVGVHLKYVSPLGNVAGSKKRKKEKTPSKQKQQQVKLVLECPSGGNRKSRRRKSRAAEKILSEVLDGSLATEVIVIPDTPTQCAVPGNSVDRASVEEPETGEPRLDGLEGSPETEASDPTRRRKKSRSRDRSNNDSLIVTDETPSNGSGKWAVESSVCSDNAEDLDDGEKKDKSKKKSKKSPSEVMEVPTATSSKKKRKKVSCEADVTEVASPCKKKRRVMAGEEPSESVTLDDLDPSESVTLDDAESREENVTIDLEAEDEAVTVLSDDEADDIIVLGSPVVPSVRGYKAVAGRRPQARPAKHAWPGDPSIIARAVAALGAPMYTPPPAPAVPPTPPNVYGGNIYNPGGSSEKKGLRPIIIDASNVAMGHGNGKVFSCRGIEICVNYFLKRKHKVFAFLPKFRRHNMYTKDAHLLDKLQTDNHLIFTPSRYVDGHSDVPYDDRYIVQTAAELGGVIVSTDNYRDLLRENPHWHDTIKNRLLMFTWVEDLLIFPQDPLGRRGCRLEEFLRF